MHSGTKTEAKRLATLLNNIEIQTILTFIRMSSQNHFRGTHLSRTFLKKTCQQQSIWSKLGFLYQIHNDGQGTEH